MNRAQISQGGPRLIENVGAKVEVTEAGSHGHWSAVGCRLVGGRHDFQDVKVLFDQGDWLAMVVERLDEIRRPSHHD